MKLGTIVLQRSDGRDVPALRELELQMARRDLPVAGAFNTFQPGTSRHGSNTYATDAAGRERVVARMVRETTRSQNTAGGISTSLIRGTSLTFPPTVHATVCALATTPMM